MSYSIQTNVSSIMAQENLRVNGDFQSRTINRLTSGYRINSSGDDAAGLAVANKLRSGNAELQQGVRNANDGISTLQIIDGGLNNISKILDRLKTLATQSASATFGGDRTTVDNEFQTLLGEIDRQSASIGLNTGGASAVSLSVYIGGGNNHVPLRNLSAAHVGDLLRHHGLELFVASFEANGIDGEMMASADPEDLQELVDGAPGPIKARLFSVRAVPFVACRAVRYYDDDYYDYDYYYYYYS